MALKEGLQPGDPTYKRIKRDYQPLNGSDFLLNPFLKPVTSELPQAQVAIEWADEAATLNEGERNGHERAFGRLFANLEQQGVTDSVLRVEVYAPNNDGLVPCLVVEDSTAYGTDTFENAVRAHKNAFARLETQRDMDTPWHRIIATMDDIEPTPEGRQRIFGNNPQLLATARMQPKAA